MQYKLLEMVLYAPTLHHLSRGELYLFRHAGSPWMLNALANPYAYSTIYRNLPRRCLHQISDSQNQGATVHWTEHQPWETGSPKDFLCVRCHSRWRLNSLPSDSNPCCDYKGVLRWVSNHLSWWGSPSGLHRFQSQRVYRYQTGSLSIATSTAWRITRAVKLSEAPRFFQPTGQPCWLIIMGRPYSRADVQFSPSSSFLPPESPSSFSLPSFCFKIKYFFHRM